MRTLLRKIEFRNFNQEFGFVPALDSDPLIRDAEQKIVDCHLAQLAGGFRTVAWNEETSVALLKQAAEKSQILGAIDALEFNRLLLREAKADFWRAHGLAKRTGFSVKEKHSDYLPTDLDKYL